MKPSPQQSSFRSALKQASSILRHQSDSPALDAVVLLEHASGRRREWLLAHDRETMSEIINSRFQDLLAQRQRGVPIAYITNEKEFWSLSFTVNQSVLIPRPDTELLVETALQIIQSEPTTSLLDLGTGSGCIAISIAKECPQLSITAVDQSADALAVAHENKQRYQTSNVSLLQSNWFENLSNKSFDLIVSNPPYIAENDPHLHADTRKYEPKSAWHAENNGLAAIEQIISHARDHLTSNGKLLLEHGWQQQQSVQELLNQHQFQDTRSLKDLQGYERITVASA